MIGDLNSIPDDVREAVRKQLRGIGLTGHDWQVDAFMETVWPAVEAHWRNTIADEIGLARDAYSPEWDVDASTVAIRRGGYTDAAAVARGKGDQ